MMQPNYQKYTARMAGIQQEREGISKSIEQEFPDREKYKKLQYVQGRGWKPRAKPQRLIFLESELGRINEVEKSIDATFKHWERAEGTREARVEKRELEVTQRKSSLETLQYQRKQAASSGEGTREEMQYLAARQTHKAKYGSVPEYKPIKYTGSATKFTKGFDERKTGVLEGVPYNVPKESKVSQGFLRQLGIQPQGPREDYAIEREKRYTQKKEDFIKGVASYHREVLISKQSLVAKTEYFKRYEAVSPGFRPIQFMKGAAKAKKEYDTEALFYANIPAKKDTDIDYFGFKKSIKVASAELNIKDIKSRSGFETRVQSLTDWEKGLNIRATKARENLGLGVLNYSGQESELGKIGKGFGNVAYYASGLGTAEFAERAFLSTGKAYATAEGLFRTPQLTKKELGRAGKETAKVYDIRTPTGLVTWTVALAAPLGPMMYNRYSKAGQVRAALKAAKPTKTRITQYYGLKESKFGMKSDIKVTAGGKTVKARGPVTQEYNILKVERGPAVATSSKMFGVTTKKSYQYTTTKVKLYGKDYFVRSKATPAGRVTTKVFRGDVLLKTLKSKAQPGVVFTEPRTVMSKKKLLEHYGDLDEFRIEQISGLKTTRGIQARPVSRRTFKYSEYYPTGKGYITSQESLGVHSIRLKSETAAFKPFIYNLDTGKMSPSSVMVNYGRTKYKFITDFTRPKSIKIIETDISRVTKVPALSKTTQKATLRGVYEITYDRRVPKYFDLGRNFADMKVWKSKRASAYKLEGITTTRIEAPMTAISQAKSGLTFYNPILSTKTASLVSFVPVLQSEEMTKDVLKSRATTDSIFKTEPQTKQSPITQNLLKDISLTRQQPISMLRVQPISISDVTSQTISQTKLSSITKQTYIQVPVSKLITGQITGFKDIGFPEPRQPGPTPILADLYLPNIKPEKKKKKKESEQDSPFNPKYFASVEATLFNIKGTMPGDVRTGLNIRPIVGL